VCAWLLAAVVLIGGTTQRPPENGTVNRETRQFEIAKDGDLIILPVRLGDASYLFELDASASHHFFDISLRPRLGEPLDKGMTTSAELQHMESTMVRTPHALVGDLTLGASERSVVLDLAAMRRCKEGVRTNTVRHSCCYDVIAGGRGAREAGRIVGRENRER
jgi:hypothetical protein